MSIQDRYSNVVEWFTATRLFKIFVCAVLFNILFTAGIVLRLESVATNTNELVAIVRQQTSPEQLEENDRKLNEFANTVVLAINCDNQENNQRIIDLIVESGVLSVEDANTLTDECAEPSSPPAGENSSGD